MFFKHKQATQTQTKHRTQRVYISYSLLVLLTRVWRALTLILLVYFFAGHIAVAVAVLHAPGSTVFPHPHERACQGDHPGFRFSGSGSGPTRGCSGSGFADTTSLNARGGGGCCRIAKTRFSCQITFFVQYTPLPL
jgi:hypothetical protein